MAGKELKQNQSSKSGGGGGGGEDTGTQSPAGEGDEAQLGIIKPSTVSMKEPGSQAGLVVPPDRAAWIGTDYTAVSLHFTVFLDQRKRDKSDCDSAVEMRLDENPENTA
ncbi:hypothetical protein PAMA_017600 [Pampus argenteus]